jgi:hypothetical protein
VTAMIDESAPASMVQCPCGKLVAPTVPGGNRPRPHHDEKTGRRCKRYKEVTAARCKRCGGTPSEPNLLNRAGGRQVLCSSDVFHPQTWTLEIDEERGPELVGNSAACGAVLGVSGEQWQWYGRPQAAIRAPDADGYDLVRRVRYWRIAAAEEYRDRLPSRRRREDDPEPAVQE